MEKQERVARLITEINKAVKHMEEPNNRETAGVIIIALAERIIKVLGKDSA